VLSESILAFVAAGFSLLLVVAGLMRKKRNLAAWCFALGMAGLAADAVLGGMALQTRDVGKLALWQDIRLGIKAALTAAWLCFSVVYSRGDARQSLRRSWLVIFAMLALPLGAMALFPGSLIEALPVTESPEFWLKFRPGAKFVNVSLLIGTVLILTNLERTFRAAVGTMQWRIKFMILGLAVIFGAGIYTRSQALVFSGHLNTLTQTETIALIIGCALMTVGYFRSGFSEIDVYPSRAVLHTSITVLLVGSYLFVIGVLAQIVARTGGWGSFQLQAFLVLIGIALLAVLLLSERWRQRVKNFVSHHFKRPHYDSREVWARFTQSISRAIDDTSLCTAASGLISQTFNVLSVSIWIYDEGEERLTLAASTSQSRPIGQSVTFTPAAIERRQGVFNLEKIKEDWGASLRQISEMQFKGGGDRICIPLLAGDRWLGFAILADRVGGVPYTLEEFELLRCVGDQIASSLLNLRLAREIMLSKELEAFQTISAFFVHDLKNAASSLNLMLQNLPVHFDNPAFRQDALRGIGETTSRINQIVERLSMVRQKLELQRAEVDLNALIEQALQSVNGVPGVELKKQLQPLPRISADPEQLRSVVTNLLLNAREALTQTGEIELRTAERDGWVTLVVRDTGCGMTPEFVRDSLFRPFKTTKKKGIGIGMFQTKMIVEAHQGTVRVRSEVGKGTTFQIALPVSPKTP
jgi:putative PEP-CTERM system histidine kinase